MEVIVRRHRDGSRTEYTYDDAQRHIRTTDFDVDDGISCDIHYDYNDSSQVNGWRVYQPADVLFMRFERRYHPNGEIEEFQYSPEGDLQFRFVERFDEEKRWQQITYDACGRKLE